MKKVLMLAALLLAASISAPGQDAKPNFSGKWVLDVAKSDFGVLTAPGSQTNTIDHQEPKLKLVQTSKGQQGERTTERNLTTDGEENSNTLGPNTMKSRTKWDGKLLLTDGKLEIQGNTVEIKEKWDLAEDGKQLTISRDLKNSQGETSQKLLFNKE